MDAYNRKDDKKKTLLPTATTKDEEDIDEAHQPVEVLDDEELLPKLFLREWLNDSFAASNPFGEN